MRRQLDALRAYAAQHGNRWKQGLSGANVAALVRDLTRAQGVSFTASPLGAFAGAVSRLSDAEVRPDEIEDLLVAFARAGIITSADSMALQAAHLRQTEG
jgi:hypothetical protein